MVLKNNSLACEMLNHLLHQFARGSAVAAGLPEEGYLRLPQIIGNPKATPPIPAIIPVSRSTWLNGVRKGRFPKPVKTLGSRITVWRVSDIRDLLK
jgi:prophage regulatory protein